MRASVTIQCDPERVRIHTAALCSHAAPAWSSSVADFGRLLAAQGMLRNAIATLLRLDGADPIENPRLRSAATAWLAASGWKDGLDALITARPGCIRFSLDPGARVFTPEWAPCAGTRGMRLDQFAPLYLRHGFANTISRKTPPVRSIALLYDSGDKIFAEIAERVYAGLASAIKVESFRGSDITGDSEAEIAESAYRECMRGFDAVVFIGHGDASRGWRLGHDRYLSPQQLAGIARENARLGGGNVPRLVVAASCSSAPSQDPEFGNPNSLFASLFESGMVDFVGTSQPLWLAGGSRGAESLAGFLSDFLRAWSEDSTGLVFHLHAAKRRCGFPAWVSLFQLHTIRDPAPRLGEDLGPVPNPMLWALGPGTILEPDTGSPLRVERLLWRDARSSGLLVRNRSGRKREQVLQVPADAYQIRVNLAREMDQSVGKLPPGTTHHLLPCARLSLRCVPWEGHAGFPLHAFTLRDNSLLPSGNWMCLEPSLPRTSPEIILSALTRVQEWHGQGLAHGRLRESSFLGQSPKGHLLLKDAWVSHLEKREEQSSRFVDQDEMHADIRWLSSWMGRVCEPSFAEAVLKSAQELEASSTDSGLLHGYKTALQEWESTPTRLQERLNLDYQAGFRIFVLDALAPEVANAIGQAFALSLRRPFHSVSSLAAASAMKRKSGFKPLYMVQGAPPKSFDTLSLRLLKEAAWEPKGAIICLNTRLAAMNASIPPEMAAYIRSYGADLFLEPDVSTDPLAAFRMERGILPLPKTSDAAEKAPDKLEQIFAHLPSELGRWESFENLPTQGPLSLPPRGRAAVADWDARMIEEQSDASIRIAPRSILIEGPGQSGKTELTRYLAFLRNAPAVRLHPIHWLDAPEMGWRSLLEKLTPLHTGVLVWEDWDRAFLPGLPAALMSARDRIETAFREWIDRLHPDRILLRTISQPMLAPDPGFPSELRLELSVPIPVPEDS